MHYFAYGSNMLIARLQARVGPVRVRGTGSVAGRHLRFHKAGRDGSGKCDIHPTGNAFQVVHGVVFEIHRSQKDRLDHFEGLGKGYDELRLTVTLGCGGEVEAMAYTATHRDPGLRPYDWYHALVVAGAREHRLPEFYLDSILRVKCVADPDEARSHAHRRLLIP